MYLILNINSRCVTSKPRSDSAGRNPSPMPPRKKPAAAAKSAPRRQPAKPKSGTKAKGARKSISKPAITGKPESKAFTKKLVKVKQEVKKEKIRQANLRAKQRAADDDDSDDDSDGDDDGGGNSEEEQEEEEQEEQEATDDDDDRSPFACPL